MIGKGVYVAGSTLGSLPEGGLLGETDGFLLKFLPKTGTEVWTRQLGTDDFDRVYGMAADAKGVVVVGTTHGVVAGDANAGDRDAFAIEVAFTELAQAEGCSEACSASLGSRSAPSNVSA